MSNLSAGYTQFCITGLQESLPEEPKMPKNCFLGPTRVAYSAPQAPIWWAGGLPPPHQEL